MQNVQDTVICSRMSNLNKQLASGFVTCKSSDSTDGGELDSWFKAADADDDVIADEDDEPEDADDNTASEGTEGRVILEV